MARVAVFYPWIYLKSGIERTILEINRRSRHEIAIYTSHYDPAGTFPDFRDLDVRELERVSVKRTYFEVFKAVSRLFKLKFSRKDADALVICCDGVGSVLSFRNGHLPLMNLCFTPLRAVYDFDYRDRLLQRGGMRRVKALAGEAFRIVDRRAWPRFDSVICNSIATKNRVVQGGLLPERDIIVAYPGVAASSIGVQGPMGDYFFLPGRIMWTKNIELAIDAFRIYRAGGGKLSMIVAGMVDHKSQEYFSGLQRLAEGCEGISFETQVSDQRMRELYEGCRAVVLSAFNEDQGLTPLEGMACGKPTIAVNRGGPKESVVNGETGFLTEPVPEDFARAMVALGADAALAQEMGLAGIERVKDFTWERFIDVFDREIDRIIASKPQ